METVTLSSKSQLVIPKGVRNDAHIAAGSRLEVLYLDGEIKLRPLPDLTTSSLDAVAGCLFNPPQASAERLALNAFVQGMDFSDALHLVLSKGEDALITFDKAFLSKRPPR